MLMTIRMNSADHQALAQFRFLIRCYLNNSEKAARSAGLEPQQYAALRRDGETIASVPGTDREPVSVRLPSGESVRIVSFGLPGHLAFLVGNVGEQQLRQVAQSLSGPLYSRFAQG